MSTEAPTAETRRYRKRLRAEQEQQTRQAITEAAVKLHGTLGPARTTVSAIAEEAGVQRATVYRHFPDEPSLFQACSARHVRPVGGIGASGGSAFLAQGAADWRRPWTPGR